MAEGQQNTTNAKTNLFNKGLVKDYNDTFIGDGFYTHARNAVNNSHEGQLGVISNEPANLFCVDLPYTLIGCIHLGEDQWVVFTTDDIASEIGLFDESECSYKKIVNDQCLNFKKTNLITGVSRTRYDCQRLIYWDDGRNPTRTMNIDDVPFKYTERIVNGCLEKTYTNQLDCEAIRIAPLIVHPCLRLSKGNIAGTLPNGSYQVCIAYTINQIKVTDYIGLSEVQGLFTHLNVGSALIVDIEQIDQSFDEFELVLVANINQQSVARRVGYYSTSVGQIYIDRFSNDFETIPIGDVVLRTSPVEKSDALFNVGSYLIRSGVYSRFKFNYQLQANKIRTKWAAVQYPADYYVKGGNNTGYLRDEQYAFFIRWIYNTGERSESYHIPGRVASGTEKELISGADVFENADGVERQLWQVENTGIVDNFDPSTLPDGGQVVARGTMAYWESTELYPADRRDIWGNLCGKPIRHHKFPDVTVDPILNHFGSGGNTITILGVYFEGITHPLDNDGNPIESIVGYEILRGSRQGSKSIIAKGLLNNMRQYTIPGNNDLTGLYQNYPYNDLRGDVYLTSTEQTGENGNKKDKPNSPSISTFRRDNFSFHSPEVTFSNPYLAVNEVKIYQELTGTARGQFQRPYQHPKFKLITNGLDTALDVMAAAIATAEIASAAIGSYKKYIASTKDPIPVTEVGIQAVMAEGPFGSIAATLQTIAVGINLAFDTAYVALFGTRVTKQQLLQMVEALIPFKQYAAQYISHGFYNNSVISVPGNRRRKVVEGNYIGNSLQQFTGDYLVNNLNRSRFVCLKLNSDIADPTTSDSSRFTISQSGKSLNQNINSQISSHYGALKISIPSQYGQLESIKQIPISDCITETQPIKKKEFTSPIYFGGDVYINRYTEKNSMLFFNTWLSTEQDGFEFNYANYPSLPYPRYWVNSQQFIGLFSDRASEYRSLDRVSTNWFYVKEGYFYLFNSGVRDFFVESEINLAYRDWEDEIPKRHYDQYSYTDIQSMFRSDIVASGNFYMYDYSLSIAKLFNSQITWAELLPRDYNPEVYETCYVYQPETVIYSLPQNDQAKKDSFRVFLPNNFYQFPDRVTSIKSINKTGALFMMPRQSPLQFMGVEELRMDGTGAKVTIGDGGLFENDRQLQSIVNADDSYEYGSNQSRYAVVGTAKGVFWVSQEQGRVFQYFGGLKEISANGLRWWFARHLPSELLKVYPNYTQPDNVVIGVGVHMAYDNTNEVVYICKKDYRPKYTDMTYADDGKFYYKGAEVAFTDPDFFENASWTASFDIKTESWVSFHDWIPTFLLPGKNHFMSVNKDSIWKHNSRCDLFANYYGVDYPFEVEYVSGTGQTVDTLRSIEYLLEGYKYYNSCLDHFHILDANFDHAIIYNSEQVSGYLNLYLKNKTNPLDMLNYPKINGNSIDINFSKEEQKYRFNQFWDITKDRGEFTGAMAPMFITEPNGYKFEINPRYVDYSKAALQRKKFRHYVNRVWLRKNVSGDVKYLFSISNQKLQLSQR